MAAAVYNGPSQFCCCFHTCTAFHLFSDHRLANSFCAYFGDTLGLPIVSDAILVILVWAFGCGSGPFFVLVCFFLLAKRKSGRKICVSSLCCLVLFVCFLHGSRFMTPRRFITFAIYLTASLCQDRAFRAKSPQ